jgi:hypothetical protein
MENKDPPEGLVRLLAVAVCRLPPTASFLIPESMKIKKGHKITFADINGVFGNVVKLASLIYELYKIVAHR